MAISPPIVHAALLDIFPPMINGTLREHYLLLFGSAGAFALIAGFIGAWVGARLASRSALQRATQHGTGLEAGQVRQLAESVDAIALEVERIAEAQRFVAKVLVERHEAAPVPAPRREPSQITPH